MNELYGYLKSEESSIIFDWDVCPLYTEEEAMSAQQVANVDRLNCSVCSVGVVWSVWSVGVVWSVWCGVECVECVECGCVVVYMTHTLVAMPDRMQWC